jgi:hypothetical protein
MNDDRRLQPANEKKNNTEISFSTIKLLLHYEYVHTTKKDKNQKRTNEAVQLAMEKNKFEQSYL